MFKPFDNKTQHYLQLISFISLIAFLILAVLSILRVVHLDEIFPPCFFFTKTGFFCPSCGGTRSFLHFINGDLIGSLKYNIFVLYFFIIIILGSASFFNAMKKVNFNFCPIHLVAMPMLLLLNCAVHNVIILFF